MGSSVHLNITCLNGHVIKEWKAQPLLGRLPSFTLLCPASSIFLSGKIKMTRRCPENMPVYTFLKNIPEALWEFWDLSWEPTFIGEHFCVENGPSFPRSRSYIFRYYNV